MRNLIISQATLVLPDGVRRTPLYVRDGRVSATRPPDAWEINLSGHLVFPGLINAHDHLHLNSIPPLPQGAPFPNSYAWIAALQAHRSEPRILAATAVRSELRHYHGGLKNLLSGATTVLHHDPWHTTFDDSAFPVRVLAHLRWSHSLGMGQRGAGARTDLPAYGPPIAESFAATSADEPWIIHLAEGTDEVARAELSRLDALGCLAPHTVIVHGVGLSESDTGLLMRRGAAVVWCPASNLAILGSTLEPRRLFDAGRLALGTDSRLSGARDLLMELKVAAAHSDLTPRELLRLVTANAARVLRAPLVGGLGTGQHADLLVLRDQGGDPYEQLLAASRRDVCAVVRGGLPAVADREFADWFAACGRQIARVHLEGREKLLAAVYARPAGQAHFPPEPGLEW